MMMDTINYSLAQRLPVLKFVLNISSEEFYIYRLMSGDNCEMSV